MEITQDLWMKVWTSPATIKVDEREDAGRFLLKYLSFRVLDHFRHLSREVQVVADDDMVERCAEEFSYTHVSEELEAADVQHLLDEALKQLPPFSREVFMQRWNEHRSVKEVAEQLHADPHTVRVHYGNALRHIRHYVESQYTRRHISENTYLLFMFIMQAME